MTRQHTTSRAVASLAAGVALALAWILPAMAQGVEGVEVTIEPESAQVGLGDIIDLDVRVDNPTDQPTAFLVVHIDITDPNLAGSVDPEDWTETLSRGVGIIEPGGSASVSWSVQPISGGDFSLYAVALSPDSSEVAVSSPATLIAVDERRSLNPEGILPVAIAAPVVVGGLLVVQQRAARRRRVPAERSP